MTPLRPLLFALALLGGTSWTLGDFLRGSDEWHAARFEARASALELPSTKLEQLVADAGRSFFEEPCVAVGARELPASRPEWVEALPEPELTVPAALAAPASTHALAAPQAPQAPRGPASCALPRSSEPSLQAAQRAPVSEQLTEQQRPRSVRAVSCARSGRRATISTISSRIEVIVECRQPSPRPVESCEPTACPPTLSAGPGF